MVATRGWGWEDRIDVAPEFLRELKIEQKSPDNQTVFVLYPAADVSLDFFHLISQIVFETSQQ